MTTEPNNDNNDNDDDREAEARELADSIHNEINPDLTPDERKRLETELHNYRKAMEEEFATATQDTEDPDKIYESALTFFKKESPSAAAQIVFLSRNSTSDSTRLNASKYILDCLRKGMVDSADDPVSEILKRIMNGDPAEEEADNTNAHNAKKA